MELELELSLDPRTVVHPADLVARARFVNAGMGSIELDTLPVMAPALALMLRRASEATSIALGPPPVPPLDDGRVGRVTLAPAAAHEIEYRGFLPQPLAPGNYELCLRYRSSELDLRSPWVAFRVV
jgi:hypothetical protein